MKAAHAVTLLGQVMKLEYGKPLPQEQRTGEQGVPAYGANGILCWSKKAFRQGPGIIVGRKGSAGEVNLTEGPFWPTDVTFFVEHDSRATELKYLYYLLKFLDLPALAKGVKPGINRNDVYVLPARIPPLEEQKRIVAILDEAFEGIAKATANAESNLAKTRELFDSRLAEAFSRASESCPSRRLGDVVSRLTNGFVGPTRDIYVDCGIPYLLARHVRDNQLQFDRRTYVSDAFNEKNKRSKLLIGDVLLVQSGHIGHSAVVGPEHEGHNCHAMIVITPVTDQIIGDYLSFYFMRHLSGGLFEDIRSGSTVPHLTCGLVKEMMIPLPSLDEQSSVVAGLQSAQSQSVALRAVYVAKIEALKHLKQSLLHKAFTGRLTSADNIAT